MWSISIFFFCTNETENFNPKSNLFDLTFNLISNNTETSKIKLYVRQFFTITIKR